MITTYCKMSCSGAAQYYHNNVIARKIILIFISRGLHAWKSTESRFSPKPKAFKAQW